jgi:hypothetical protein
VNSEERPPGRTGIINHLRGIVHAIGIRGLELQVGNGAQGKGVGLRVITRTGSLSWSTPSTGEEEFETREGRTRPDAGGRDLGAGRFRTAESGLGASADRPISAEARRLEG